MFRIFKFIYLVEGSLFLEVYLLQKEKENFLLFVELLLLYLFIFYVI